MSRSSSGAGSTDSISRAALFLERLVDPSRAAQQHLCPARGVVHDRIPVSRHDACSERKRGRNVKADSVAHPP
jgi:hypothetical protein